VESASNRKLRPRNTQKKASEDSRLPSGEIRRKILPYIENFGKHDAADVHLSGEP